MDGVFVLLVGLLPVLVVVLAGGAMWLYPEIHLKIAVGDVTFEVRGRRPCVRAQRRHQKHN